MVAILVLLSLDDCVVADQPLPFNDPVDEYKLILLFIFTLSPIFTVPVKVVAFAIFIFPVVLSLNIFDEPVGVGVLI